MRPQSQPQTICSKQFIKPSINFASLTICTFQTEVIGHSIGKRQLREHGIKSAHLPLLPLHQIVPEHTQNRRSTDEPEAVVEPPSTASRPLQINQDDHARHRHGRRSTSAQKVRRSKLGQVARHDHQADLNNGEDRSKQLRRVRKPNRHALHARLDIIPDILMSVDGIVDDRPQDVGNPQTHRRHQGLRTKRIHAERGAAHGDGPRKRKAQHDLGIVGQALGEGIEAKENGDGHGMPGALAGQEGKQRHARDRQREGEQMPLRGGDRSARNGPQPAPGHLAVEVLVDVVVPGAGGPAQDHAPDEEEHAEEGEVAG